MTLNEPFEQATVLTRDQVRELDRVASAEFGLPGVVLMENAGRELARALLDGCESVQRVLVLCGAGNNGGDGYVLARYLHDAGHSLTLLETARPADLAADAAVFRETCAAMGVPLYRMDAAASLDDWLLHLPRQDIVVDALIGTGFHGELREPLSRLLSSVQRAVQGWNSEVVAVDCPSGLDVDSGEADPAVLCAQRTLTLACSKPAFEGNGIHEHCGAVRVLSIGIPRAAYERLL